MKHIPRLVLAPSLAASLVFVYAFILWTVLLSLTGSTLLPRFDVWVGLKQYERLWALPRWRTAARNLLVYGGLYVGLCLALGVFLAVLLDLRLRAEGLLRSVFLYPMALSFIVTGTAWKWLLDPELGLDRLARHWGLRGLSCGWLADGRTALYAVAAAAVWQSSGFVMALFLAALRGVDANLFRAAAIDGAGLTAVYARVVLPSLRPVFACAAVLLAHNALKTFDLVVALTGGGPGCATDLPAVFMHAYAFQRSELGLASASAVMMLFTAAAVIVPLLVSESRA